MAAQLREAGQAVALLVLLDSPLPDGTDQRDAEEHEVLMDTAAMFGITDAQQIPKNAAELCALLQDIGLGSELNEADAQRGIDTAKTIVRATRRHRPRAVEVPTLQFHALRRDTPSPDWRVHLGTAPVETHTLDTDHMGLIDAECATTVAALILPHLGN